MSVVKCVFSGYVGGIIAGFYRPSWIIWDMKRIVWFPSALYLITQSLGRLAVLFLIALVIIFIYLIILVLEPQIYSNISK